MSSFDENLAEIRGFANDNNNDVDTQKESIRTSSGIEATSSSSKADPERQSLLLNHTSTSTSANEHLLDRSASSAVVEADTNDDQVRSSWVDNISGTMFFTLSTIYGATSVALGAFGAHGLKKRIGDPGRVANWSTAAQYQLIHSVALLATSIALPQRAQRIPGALFLTGMTLFSGSIYLLVLDPARFKFLGPVTPIGGLCLIGGWIGLGVVGRRFVR